MTLTLDDLLASPDHYLHSFEGDATIFVPMDREAYRRSIFLDRRISPPSTRSMQLPAGTLIGHSSAPKQTGWIFHVAHCGSTLLARALDQAQGNLVLREPLALRQVAIEHRAKKREPVFRTDDATTTGAPDPSRHRCRGKTLAQ